MAFKIKNNPLFQINSLAMLKGILSILIVTNLFAGCSWKSYDPDNQVEYEEYWKEEENRMNSILYPFTEEAREESENYK